MEGWCGRRGGCGGLRAAGRDLAWCFSFGEVRLVCTKFGKTFWCCQRRGLGGGEVRFRTVSLRALFARFPPLPLIFAFVSLSFDFVHFQPFPPIIREKSAVFFVFRFREFAFSFSPLFRF